MSVSRVSRVFAGFRWTFFCPDESRDLEIAGNIPEDG